MPSPLTQEAYYELFPHQADIGIREVGWTEQSAFEQAALALTSIALEPEKVPDREVVFLHCQAPTHAMLLVDWLNALIYEAGTRKMIFGRFRVNLFDHHLEGIAWGDHVDTRKSASAGSCLDTGFCSQQIKHGWQLALADRAG